MPKSCAASDVGCPKGVPGTLEDDEERRTSIRCCCAWEASELGRKALVDLDRRRDPAGAPGVGGLLPAVVFAR